MSSDSKEGEPNLTPMLDMVFQLVTFFMLVINFKGAAMDLSLKLPVLGSAKPIEWHGKKEPMVLNINKEGKVNAYGQQHSDFEKFIVREAKGLRLYLESIGEPKRDEMPIPVVIRADHNVPFHHLNRIIKQCQDNGFRQFQLSAMNRTEK